MVGHRARGSRNDDDWKQRAIAEDIAAMAAAFEGEPVHKAEPNADDIACVHCGLDIARVPGGQGPTWIHTATGAVAGSGAPR